MPIQSYLLRNGGFERGIPLEDLLEAARPDGVFAWVDLEDPSEEDLAVLAEKTGIHQLTVEDILSEEGRARVEEFPDHLHVVFKALNFNTGEDLFDVINVDFLVFKDLLVTAHGQPIRSVLKVREVFEKTPQRFKVGPAALLHAILERIVELYFGQIEELQDALEDLEPKVLGELDHTLPEKIYAWKRGILHLRRRTGPHREVLVHLCTVPTDVIPESYQIYFRDVLDKVMRIDERLASYRELLQSASELYIAGAAQETNEVMKTLSIVATVVLPLNILTGLYGTNFEILPGSKAEAGFWIFLGAMVAFALTTAIFFRWRRWI